MTAVSKPDAGHLRRGRPRRSDAAPMPSIDLLAVLVPNDPAARSVIRAEAARRDLTAAQLLQRLVATVAADRLFVAVLDDADEIARRRR